MPATSVPSAVPASLRVAVALLAAQAAALGALTLFLVYEDITATSSNLTAALVVTLFPAIGAVILGLLAKALWRRRGGARGIAVALELIVLAPAYFMINGGLAWLGWTVLATSATVIGALMTPASAQALGLGPHAEDRG